jgi:pimeloyl-ACP methyl ester carboxylesterase
MEQAKGDYLHINTHRVSTYHWGNGGKLILLLHGWESRTSRFYLIIKEFLKKGYQIVSFDAPGHGASEGKTTNILENYEIIAQLQKIHGTFEAIIAHSLGVLNAFFAAKQDIATKTVIAISGVSDFSFLPKKYAGAMGLQEKAHQYLRKNIEQYFLPRQNIWTDFSAYCEPEKIKSHLYIIHDKNDEEVNIMQSELLYKTYQDKANIHITNSLGHHRILSNLEVIKLMFNYLESLERHTFI